MSLPSPSPSGTALVTGASSGIGAEIARCFARKGHNVALVARRVEPLAQLAGELRALGVRAEVLPCDLVDRDQRARLADQVAELGLEVEVLVNNAGLSTIGPISRADVEREIDMVELDVVAVVDLCTRFLPGMVQRGRGAILNVASTAAFQPLPGQAGYGASKSFVLSYTRALGGELRGTGVVATALCPGPVETGFGEAAGFTEEETKGALPPFMWETAVDVAAAGVEGLASGAPVVIPGLANRAAAAMSQLVPKRLLVPLVARQHPGLRRP
jgi:uncharacterized protein